MNGPNESFPSNLAELSQAEKRLVARTIDPNTLSREECLKLIRELQTHQVELEAQNQELRQAQVKLRAANEKLEALFQAAPLAIGVFDNQGRVVSVNPASERMFGWPLVEILGRLIPSTSKEDAEASQDLLQRMLQGESLVGAEFHQRRRDGSLFEVSLSSAPICGPEGKIQGFVALAEDITERKQKEAALQTQARVLESMAEGVTVTDNRGAILYTNPAFDAMFGYEPGELVGQHSNILNFYPPEENTRVVKNILKSVGFHGIWIGEFHNRKKDGQSFFTAARISTLEVGGEKLFISVQEDITERQQVEKEIRRLASFPELNPNPVLEVDEEGRILYSNPVVQDLVKKLGLAEGVNAFLPPDLKQAFVAARQGSPQEYEFDLSIKDKVYAVKLSFPGDLPTARLYALDITARKRAEEALQESERRFRHVVESIPQLVWTSRPDGPCDFLNRQWLDYTGIPEAEQLGYGWLEQIHPDDREKLIQAWQTAVADGSDFNIEFRIRRHDGVYHWFVTRAVPWTDAAGQIVKWFGTNTNITDFKQALEALKQERDFSAALLNTLGALVVVLDREERMVLFNQACEIGSGYALAEVAGKYFFDIFVLPEEKASVQEAFGRLKAGEVPLTYESHWLTRTGQKRLMRWSNTTLKNADGEVTYVIGTGIDITRQRRAEEALRRAHDELERRVAARTEQHRRTVDKLLQEITERERAETRLRESEVRFAAFMKHLPGSAIMRDREGRFLFVNEAWEDALGRRQGESLGKRVDDFWPPEIAEKLKALDQQIFVENRPFETTVELPIAGQNRTFLSYRFPIRSDDGKVEMVGAIGIDITDRLKAEEARDRLIEILEATPDFVGTADREGRLFYLNRGAKEMLGLTPQEDFISLNFSDTQPPWAVDLILTEGRPIYAREGFWQGETAILCRDGAETPVSQVILAHRSPEGRIKFFSTICRDISEMKRAEEKLRKSEDKLKLLTAQLLTAQEDERTRLAAELHDELGHALLTLKLHLTGLEQYLLPEQTDLKEKIIQMVQYLTDTVEEVRRLYYALSPGDLEDLGLTTALRNMVEDFRDFYQDIDWHVDLVDLDSLFSLPIQTMIYRIVQEALTNIGKHAYPGHVKVKVTREDQKAVFVIEDDGQGFSMDEVLEGDKRGMGLAAMIQRVNLAGGNFDLWSQENQGARIVFSIPVPPPE
jgi:PAS domain S-box-containing protein